MSIPPEHEAPTDDLPDSLGEDPQVEAPADTSGREPAPEGPVGVEQGSISDDEAEMLDESAQELTPIKNLARATEHTKFIITTVGTIGTLLAGAGGVTAAVALNRTTVYWQGIPVVPVGALLTSVFAGLSVGIALWGRRPSFTVGNAQRLEDVKAWFEAEIGRKREADSMVVAHVHGGRIQRSRDLGSRRPPRHYEIQSSDPEISHPSPRLWRARVR